MADPTQFNFSFAELAELLIKQQGLHEGLWTAGVEFNVNVAAMGMTQEAARPGVMLLVNQIQLSRVSPGQQPPHLIVDAAVVNPSKSSSKPARKPK